jgi:hypothetical protein
MGGKSIAYPGSSVGFNLRKQVSKLDFGFLRKNRIGPTRGTQEKPKGWGYWVPVFGFVLAVN